MTTTKPLKKTKASPDPPVSPAPTTCAEPGCERRTGFVKQNRTWVDGTYCAQHAPRATGTK